MKMRLLIALLCGVVLSVPLAAGAEIRSATPLWGSWARRGHWIPLEVALDNRGAAVDVEVALEFSSDSRVARYYTTVNMPSTSRKSVMIYGLVEDLDSFTATVPGARNPKLDLKPLEANDSLVGVLSREEGGLSFLGSLTTVGKPPVDSSQWGWQQSWSAQGKLNVQYVAPNRAPDRWVGYDALRLLVLLDGTTRDFDEKRAEALKQWVAAGGALVVTGGSEWQRLREGIFAELLPVEVTAMKLLAGAPSLARRYGVELATAPIAVAMTTLKQGLVYASEPGTPLIVRGRYGAGQVIFLAFDPSKPPLVGWRGNRSLWRDVLKWADDRPRVVDPAVENTPVQAFSRRGRVRFQSNTEFTNLVSAFAQDRKEMRAPPFEIIGFFLLAYLFCLVPVNYFVLKRMDRREWAWLTTPAIVVVFTLISYGVGYRLKGGALILSKLTIVQSASEQGFGRADTVFGIFSPGKRVYNVTTSDRSATVTDIATSESTAQRAYLRVNEDDGFRVEDAAINMWTMRMFQSHSVMRLGKGVSARFRSQDGRTEAVVTNGTGLSFSRASLLTNQGNAALGPMPPNKQATATLGKVSLTPDTAIRAAALTALHITDASGQVANLAGGEALFIGQTEERLEALQIVNEKPEVASQALVAIRLPFQLEGGIPITAQLIPGVIVESQLKTPLSLDTNWGPGGATRELRMEDGWLVYEMQLPGRNPSVDGLEVRANFNASPGVVVSAYNFTRHHWVPLPDMLPGTQNFIALEPPEQFVLSPDGVVRVRVEAGSAKGIRIQRIEAKVTGRLSSRRLSYGSVG